MRRLSVTAAILFTLGVASVLAQAPTDLPRLDASAITYLGSFQVPYSDGTCRESGDDRRGCLDFGGDALGIGPLSGGQPTLYIGGHDWTDQICQITIPAIGGVATVVGRCQTIANLRQVDPDTSNSAGGWVLGGSLTYNARTIVSAFGFYDANENGSLSHFVSAPGTGIVGLTGPALTVGNRSTIRQGWVAGYMGLIPLEWRALFGGPAVTGLCCTSIIGRSSRGPALGVFDPDLLGKSNPVTWTPLVYYPDDDAFPNGSLGVYDRQHPLWNGSTMIRGVAFPSGTRSVLFIGRHGTGDYCYGTGTTNQALHQQPHPEGNRWCYDPTNSNKGDHAYPYEHRVWAYDARDFLAIKNGTAQPWSLKPYATWPLSGLPSGQRQGATIGSATYDDTTRRLYVTEVYNNNPRVHVYQIAGATAPPPVPVDCKLSEFSTWTAVTDWSACTNGQQSRQEKRTRTIEVPPANGGQACGPLEETRSVTQACTVTPPPATSITVVGTIVAPWIEIQQGRQYLFVVDTPYGRSSVILPGVRIPGATRDLQPGDTITITAAMR